MKRCLVIFLVFCLLFAAVGCSGGGGNTEENGNGSQNGDTEEPGGETPAEEALSEFYQIKEVKDIVLNFKELEYSFSDASYELIINYKLIGQETLNGMQTDHVSVSLSQNNEETLVEMWLDAEGASLKTLMNGADMGQMGDMAGMILMVVVVPFTLYAESWQEVFATEGGFEQYGWTVTERSKKSKDFGAGNVTVHEYFFMVKHPTDGSQFEYAIEVAEIKGNSMFVGWDVEMGAGVETSYKVNRIIPR